jgi:hypothetical protein
MKKLQREKEGRKDKKMTGKKTKEMKERRTRTR